MDISRIPKDILRVLQDRELSVPKKMMAFNMLMPDLGVDPKHAQAYNDNIEVGRTIKRLVDEGKLTLDGFDDNFKLKTTIK
tara:strand:+ start:231 stop:473 length:243 start_codon:yes stop_codon:yes gene_type:complete